MIIRIEKRDHPFVMMDKRPLEDFRLSFKAKGVLAYLLSRPNDWRVIIRDLQRQSPDGVRVIKGSMRELRRAGYAVLKTIRTATGFAGKEWIISEVPAGGFPEDGGTQTGTKRDCHESRRSQNVIITERDNHETCPLNKKESKNKEKSKNICPAPSGASTVIPEAPRIDSDELPGFGVSSDVQSPESVPESKRGRKAADLATAAAIYAIYPKKVARPKALASITAKLRAGHEPGMLMTATRSFAKAWESSPDRDFCPNPASWFNQERFLDDPSTWKRNGSGPKKAEETQIKETVNVRSI